MDDYAPTYLDLAQVDEAGPPPLPDWVIVHWIRMGRTTLFLGENDPYKATFAQQLVTTVALGRDCITTVPEPRPVLALMSADEDELARRQHAISNYLRILADSLSDRLFLGSTAADTDCTLVAKVQGALIPTPRLARLGEEIGDRKIQVVLLEDVARLFAGSQSDPHEILVFLAALKRIAQPTRAAIVLLTDLAKNVSPKWENCVDAHLWLSERQPEDYDGTSDGRDAMPDVRYLFKRKYNYASHDVCRLVYASGAFSIIDPPGSIAFTPSARFDQILHVLIEGFARLRQQGIDPTPGRTSPDYLPKKLTEMSWNKGFTKKDLETAMLTSGRFRRVPEGQYGNRGRRDILVMVDNGK